MLGVRSANRGDPEVKWIAQDAATYVLPLMAELQEERRRERSHALFVTVLTVACAGFLAFDLFLLVSSV